jgi:GT2 family glycosyltransferase
VNQNSTNRPDVSIIIVSWNTRDLLAACLRSIPAGAKTVSHEIIVIDNDSRDGSAECVAHTFPHVRLLVNRENRGFAAACNQGIRSACGRYILLLNSDTVVLDDCLDNVVRFADAHPSAGAIGCRVLNTDRTVQYTCMRYPSLLNLAILIPGLHRLFPRSRLFGREDMTWWTYDSVREVGLLDDSFFMYGEDTDWCYRMRQAGWSVLFTPCGQIIHHGQASSRQVEARMKIELWRAVIGVVSKHHGPAYTAAFRLGVRLLFVQRMIACSLVGLLRPRCRAAMLAKAAAYRDGLRSDIFNPPSGTDESTARRQGPPGRPARCP